MRLSHASGFWVGCTLAAISLISCGIRLPIDSQPIRSSPVRKEVQRTTAQPSPDLLVWLIADEYHTGMVFCYDWLLESGFIPPAQFEKPQYVAMSWGNSDAYTQQGINGINEWTKVLLTPTPSVMELIPFNWSVTEVCPQQRIWRRLTSRSQGPILAHFLNQCSKTQPDGRPIVVRPSSWGNGVQLQGNYPYFIPRVCNVWTVQAIECLGGNINPWLALTADGLIRQAEKSPNDFEKIWPGMPES